MHDLLSSFTAELLINSNFIAEVIDISSSEDDDVEMCDDDDVVVTKDEDNEVEDEDPNNGGNHINDEFNIPELDGRVKVNKGHPPEDPDIFLPPQLGRAIKRHQVELSFHFDAQDMT